MRLFVLVGALLAAAGAYFLIDGGIRLNRCLSFGHASYEVWTSSFWLLSPEDPSMGLSPNGQWLLRLAGGLFAVILGTRLARAASR